MQKRRVIPVVIGAALCLGAIAAAQNRPRASVRADKVVRDQPGRTTYIGNVVLTIDGVTVRASRAVLQGDEVVLDGTVRLTLPKSAFVYSAAAMRERITPPPVQQAPYAPGPKIIDTPIPQPWQPPPRNQR